MRLFLPFLARRDRQRVHVAGDGLRDEARGDRRAVVVQHRAQPRRVDLELVDQQRAHLRVAVLFDDEDAGRGPAMNSRTLAGNGKARSRIASRWMPARLPALSSASSIAGAVEPK